MPARVLLITNHDRDAGCPGAIAAVRELVGTAELAGMQYIHAGESPETSAERDSRVVRAVAESSADVILVLSLKDAVKDLDGVEKALAGRPVLYWEGDPWGRGKRMPEAMRQWLSLSRITFSVGGEPQSGLLRAAGAADVRFIPHTYDHVLFAECEKRFSWTPAPTRVGFLGSNLMRAPLVSGLPGSWQRFDLIRQLRGSLHDFALAGPGWPPGWSRGAIPFSDQVTFLQGCQLLVAWDHYPRTTDYTSDRLAISMVAGRTQVSTRHPGMGWAPSQEQGVFLVPDVAAALAVSRQCLALGDDELRELGRRAHEWARVRMSHRNAFRYMLSHQLAEVAVPDCAPWDRLPTI